VSVPIAYPLGEPEPFAIRVPGGCVELAAHGLTTTRLRGFVPVDAVPHDTDEYRARARSLGYPDDATGLLRMSREHELTHSLLAGWLGLPCSPTMRGIALRTAGIGPWFLGWRAEEACVLALQKFARLCDVDLVKLAVEAAEREELRDGQS
jgi:hypothetical protein